MPLRKIKGVRMELYIRLKLILKNFGIKKHLGLLDSKKREK